MWDASFEHEASEVAVGRQVIEPVVMDTGMGQVMGHMVEGPLAAQFQQRLIAGGVEEEEGFSEEEALGPFGPSPRGIASVHGEDGRPAVAIPMLNEVGDLGCGKLEEPVELRGEFLDGEGGALSHIGSRW